MVGQLQEIIWWSSDILLPAAEAEKEAMIYAKIPLVSLSTLKFSLSERIQQVNNKIKNGKQ